MKNSLLFLLFLSFLIVSCNYDKYKFKGYKLLEEKNSTSLYFSDISIDTAGFENLLSGLKLDISLSKYGMISDNAILETFGSGCNGYEISIELHDNKGKTLPKHNDKYDSLSNAVLAEKTIVSQPAGCKSSFFFPYRIIPLKEGLQNLYIHIQTFPVRTFKDSVGVEQSERISSKPDINVKLMQPLNFPRIYTARILVQSFELDTKKFDPSSCDIHFLGPGYPDPMYGIYSGKDIIYSSVSYKNCLSFPKPDLSDEFTCTGKDYFTFDILDFDSFGSSDILAEAVGSPFLLSRDTIHPTKIHFGYLKYLELASIIK